MTTIQSNNQTINLTTINFDEKLKEFILETKKRVDLTSLNCSKIDYNDILNTQEELRNYFVENQYEGMLQNGKRLKLNSQQNPNFYALMLLLVSNVEDYDNWSNVMILIKDQTQLDGFESKEIRELNGRLLKNQNITNNNLEFICACGKFLCSSEMYRIMNIETKMSLLLGNTCIYKNKIASTKDLKALKKQKTDEAERNYIKELSKERFRELNERTMMSKEEQRQIDFSNKIINRWELFARKYNKLSQLPYGIQILIKIVKRRPVYIKNREKK